jgi:hypothetical protein
MPVAKGNMQEQWHNAFAWNLDCRAARLYLTGMTFVLAQNIELQDRARLRERFYGAARTVLARL